MSVSPTQRLKHTHVIGATGTGKSTFLSNLIVQDIHNGEGICVLDPHGDLIESILAYIPAHRLKDVIVIDPADTEYPVGFNILSAHSDVEKDILSSDLVAIFKRQSTSWGDQMNSVFANAILAFLESTDGGTLVDLRRFLVEKSFRDSFLRSVQDPGNVYYWHKEFPLLKSGSIGPILTRLDTFLRPKVIRNMVAQRKSLDFESILDSKKILLVKLSQGLIGNENSYLLGTFFVTKIYQAAMARQMKSKEARSDFYVYIDEFQNFITPSISQLLAGARKYHVGLTLAHQEMQQLVKYDSELASSIVANAGTRICFRLGDTDAKRFASGLSYFEAADLENLNTGEAICRIERPDYDFSLNTSPLQYLDEETIAATRHLVLDYSRRKYGTSREEVEQIYQDALNHTMQDIPAVPPSVHLQPEKTADTLQTRGSTEISVEVQQSTTRQLVQQKQQSEHRYLQTLIKKMAESRGYISKIEELTPDGKGRIDVSLERNGKKIACEICVTTEKEWEVHNIEKCLVAGYAVIIACSTDEKTLARNKQKAEELLSADRLEKVRFETPDRLIAFLDEEIARDATTEVKVKGYRVKVEYSAVPQDEMNKKKESIDKAVLSSLKRKKK